MSMTSPLGRLIRDAREALDLSQEELAKRVGVKAGVNVSKWEGGLPIPWHRLDMLLKSLPNVQADEFWTLVKKHLPDAMRRYQMNRLKRDEEPHREAPPTILDFLNQSVRKKIERLHDGSAYVSVETMIMAGIEWYADLALAHGLRADLTPNIPVPDVSPPQDGQQVPDGGTPKKDLPGDKSRKVARRG